MIMEMPYWASQNQEFPNHYEVKIPSKQININNLTKWLMDIEEENCIIAIDGGSYHFASKRERLQFVAGIDLVFAAYYNFTSKNLEISAPPTYRTPAAE